jgi:predicted nucleic acid-binding protein
MSLALTTVDVDAGITQRANQLAALGYGPYDALHVAAAESAKVDILLSTDDGFVNRAVRGTGDLKVLVRNPVSWVREQRQ